jgi:hypothetical protein
MATGLTAPFVAWQLARGRGRRLAVGFNVFGLADLIDAATLGVLLGLGLFAVEPTTEILAFLPLTLLPTVAVPVALTLYIVSLRELRAGARGKDGSTSMTIPTGEPTSGARKAITAAWPAGLPATVGTGCVDRGGGADSRPAFGPAATAGKPAAREDHELRLE